MASFLVHTEVGINYLQYLNGPQMEAWALYNAVWVVNSHLSTGTVKSEQHWDRRFINQWQGSSDIHVQMMILLLAW